MAKIEPEVAARQAINSPLLEVSIDGAKGILFNVIGGPDMAMHEINAAASVITEAADQDVNVIYGTTINPALEGEIIITVVATGFDANYVVSSTTDLMDYEVESPAAETKKTLNKTSPVIKISSHEDLPSLPTKAEKKAKSKDKEEKTDDEAEKIEIEDIVKDIDTTLEKEADDKLTPNIIDDDQDESGGLWDDVDSEDDDIDLNKPTFLRKLASKRRERKERKGKDKDETTEEDFGE